MPSEKIGLLPGFKWITDGSMWFAMSFGFIATIGLLFTAAVIVEGRFLKISAQYKGIIPGDLLLAASVAASMYAVRRYMPEGIHGTLYQSRGFHVLALSLGIAMVLVLKVGEFIATVKYPGRPGVYTWGQHFSPTMLAHTAIVPVMAYLTITCGAAALFGSCAPWWQKTIVVVGVIGWAICALVLDNILPRPDVLLVHPTDGWPWQRAYWWRG